MSQLPILTAQQLLERCGIDPKLNEWRSLAGMDNGVFDALMLKPLYQFAESVQLAPASETHHHCGPGGLLKHTVDVITIALKKRRAYQLPLGGNVSEINHQRHLWTFAIFIACLLHDIGKLSANIRLIIILKNGNELQWTPHDVPLTKIEGAKSYRVEFAKTPYDYHHRVSLTHFDLIPRDGRAWISQFPLLMSELCSYLWGDRFESGVIGEIAEFADRESTARDLKLPNDQRFSNAHSAIDRYLKMIRQWISDGSIRININGGMGWVDREGHLYLVCRSLAMKLIQECNSIGLKNLPQDPIRIYDILQEHGYAKPTEDGKAIWPIQVRTETFSHRFTCLKFDASRLTLPSRPLIPLEGNIDSIDGDICETVLHQHEVAAVTQDTEANEKPSDIKNATEKKGGELNERKPAEAENQIALESEITPAASAEIQLESENIRDASKDQEPAPIRDTVDETLETEKQEDTALLKLEKSAAEAGSVTEAVSIIRNLNLEAQDTGQKFLSWLQRGLIEKTILINNHTAEVHIVDEGVFLLAPAIFKTFLRLHGFSEEKHKNLSKRFGNLRRHIRNGDLNIHPYWVSSSNRASKINGWLLPFHVIYQDGHPTPKANKYIHKSIGGNMVET